VRTDIEWEDAAAAVHCNAPRGKTHGERKKSSVCPYPEYSLSFAPVDFLRAPHLTAIVYSFIQDPRGHLGHLS